jgi:N utilization substance protein B
MAQKPARQKSRGGGNGRRTKAEWLAGAKSAATRAARLAAVQALYEMEIAGASFDSVLMDYLHDRWTGLPGHKPGGEIDRKKFGDIVKGVTVGKARYDTMIASALDKDRKIGGLDVLFVSILRAGIHELFAETKVPARVVMTEYVGIARSFYSENEPALINGVLNRIAQVVRGEELGEDSRE